MKIRGDLKVLHDLIIQTAANNAEIGSILKAKDGTGKVEWGNLTIVEVDTTKAYNTGELVTTAAYDKVYLANTDGAPGGNLTHPRWTVIGGGTGSGATENPVTTTIGLGGIANRETIPVNTNLEQFIISLLQPLVLAELVSNVSATLTINIPVVAQIGDTYTLAYSPTYNPGKIKGYTAAGEATSVDLKGANTNSYSPDNGENVVIVESNVYTANIAYGEGNTPIYNSDKTENTTFNRNSGYIVKKANVLGYYPTYFGVTAKSQAELINDFTNGIIPSDAFKVNYIVGSNIDLSTTLPKEKKSAYILLPKAKFTKAHMVTERFDTVIQTYNLNDTDINVSNLNLQLGAYSIQYELYFREFGGWTVDMGIDHVKINNI
jgi:hypothetical protein